MAGKDNLIPMSQRSKEEARECGRKGGKASGRVRREKREFKELLELALSQVVTNKATGEKASRKEVAAIRVAEKCTNGDLKAITLAAELLGEKVNKTEIQGKDGKDLFSKLSEEELRSKLEDLDRKLS
ncbi:MAG: KGG domain-containing protein [Bacteroidales bacterium]|nr:KGG domain-containing protein [Bacteroidales bacterium]